ncbi:hypothetical protein FSP39_007029 [Pinctada imbricata]|uniref:Uncharacterized protein n=1 Tax=Pinctada imbricata TaxID=66713 RepID=A0AA88YE50_PINIB|nr:hypothetical protein FSP39_007029 [Pinctada imbricata]
MQQTSPTFMYSNLYQPNTQQQPMQPMQQNPIQTMQQAQPLQNYPLLNNDSTLNDILRRLDQMNTRLKLLDSINDKVDSIDRKVVNLDLNVKKLEERIEVVENSRQFDSESMNSLQKEQKEIKVRNTEEVTELRNAVKALQADHTKSTEDIIDIQCRSMRDNLMFYNIPEGEEENCTEKIGHFMEENMKIEGAKSSIKIERAHRVGRRRRGSHRQIVAKFHSYVDREKVRSASKNLEGSNFGVGQQFPKEVQERRRILIDVMKRERARGNRCSLSVDKLFVNNSLYTGPEVTWQYKTAG